MKKVFRSRIFIVIITMIICISGTLYATTKYQAIEVLYNPSSGDSITVEEALDNLYESKTELDNIKGTGTATASDIASGKTAWVKGSKITGTMTSFQVVSLGTGTSFNVSSYSNYKNFTTSDFIIEPISGSFTHKYYPETPSKIYNTNTITPVKSYNASTGVLTAYVKLDEAASWPVSYQTSFISTSATTNMNVTAYLILK